MSWGLWEIALDTQVDDAKILQDAKVFSQSVASGETQVKPEVEERPQDNGDKEESGMI